MGQDTIKSKCGLDATQTIEQEEINNWVQDDENSGNLLEALILSYKQLKDKYDQLIKLIDPVPLDDNHLKDDLKEWLDVRGISYNSSETKAELLARCTNPHHEDFVSDQVDFQTEVWDQFGDDSGDFRPSYIDDPLGKTKGIWFEWDGVKELRIKLLDSSSGKTYYFNLAPFKAE